MAADTKTDLDSAEVDRALKAWRQGDCVLGEHWFVHRINAAFVVRPCRFRTHVLCALLADRGRHLGRRSATAPR